MRIFGAAILLFGLVLSACDDPKQTLDPQVGGESHFLESCTRDAACGIGLGCICGVCTRPCADAPCGPAAACLARTDDTLLCSPVQTLCVPNCAEGRRDICASDGVLELPAPTAASAIRYVTVPETSAAELPDTASPVEHVFFAPSGPASGRVVLLLAMTNARPQDSQDFLAAAAVDGHFAVGVAFDTPNYPDPSCGDSPMGAGACNAAIRQRTVFGDVEPPLPELWEVPDSVMFRADRLLHHMMDLSPQFAALFPNRIVDWRQVHLVAHRDAGPLAIEMARQLPVPSVGILAGLLTEGDTVAADVPAGVDLRFAARADDPRSLDLQADWAVGGADIAPWSVSTPAPPAAAWIVDVAPFAPLEGTFDSLLLDQRLTPERIHALRPLWRHLMGQ